MATRKKDSVGTGEAQSTHPLPTRMEDATALREALRGASLRVKRLAQKETESETAGEEILHFRLKSN